LRCRILAR